MSKVIQNFSWVFNSAENMHVTPRLDNSKAQEGKTFVWKSYDSEGNPIIIPAIEQNTISNVEQDMLFVAEEMDITGIDGVVYGVKVSGDYLYVGGNFRYAYEVLGEVVFQNNLCRFDTTDGYSFDDTWLPEVVYNDIGLYVYSIEANGDYIYVSTSGDRFSSNKRLMCFHKDTAVEEEIAENLQPQGGFFSTLLVDDDYLYAGGNFAKIGNESHLALCRYNIADGVPVYDSFRALRFSGLVLDTRVYSLHKSGNYLYVGGNFLSKIGNSAIMRYDLTDPDVPVYDEFFSGINGVVRGLTDDGTYLYAGGEFTRSGGGADISKIVRYTMATKDIDDTWGVEWPSYYSVPISLSHHGSYIYACLLSARTDFFLKRFLRSDASIDSWAPKISGIAKICLTNGDYVCVGGAIKSIDDTDVGSAVMVDLTTPATPVITGLGI